jgi:hypothetical protein
MLLSCKEYKIVCDYYYNVYYYTSNSEIMTSSAKTSNTINSWLFQKVVVRTKVDIYHPEISTVQ